ncbi:MAG TPA: hypothetical protein VEI97_11605 [bacterium]|nr:hypothetical protein [bacterium]
MAGPFWLGLTGAALSASARALVWIYSATLLQLQVPNQYRGRVSSVQIALIGLCDLISALLVQAALDRGWLDVRGVTVALGTYSMVVGGLYLVLGRIPLAPIVSDTAAPPSDPAPA